MTKNEIIEWKQKIINNDVDNFNKRLVELNNEIAQLQQKKDVIQRKISKKQIYSNDLEKDKDQESDPIKSEKV